MQLQKRRIKRKDGEAVSPVIGVMLMVVIVVIIAAVVSGFAGGLVAKSNQKAPTLTMDVKILNTGYWHGSGFFATVTGVSEPVQTRDLKIVTSWKHSTATSDYHNNIQIGTETGGNTIVASSPNINVLFAPNVTTSGVAPFGIGAGVNRSEIGGAAGTEGTSFSSPWQQFGNYTLMPGTTLTAMPAGAKDGGSFGSSGENNRYGGYGADNASYQITVPAQYQTCYVISYPSYPGFSTNHGCCSNSTPNCNAYTSSQSDLTGFASWGPVLSTSVSQIAGTGGTQWVGTEGGSAIGAKQYYYTQCDSPACIDPTRAVLGTKWNDLRVGDTVNVQVIYTPTGKVIFNQDVPVTEA